MRGVGIIAAVFGLVCGCGTGPIQAVGLNPDAAGFTPDTAGFKPDTVGPKPDLPLSTGLVAHWRFDDGSGTNLADSSGNGHDGTIVGSTWSWTAGKFGAALHFEQGDYVSVGGFPDATNSWTVAAWVQIPSQVASAGDATLISTEDAFKGGWELLVTSSKYHFGYWTGLPTLNDYSYAECSNCILPDRWQHLAAVVDGEAMTLALYLDGKLQTRNPIPKPISPGVSTPLHGALGDHGSGPAFAGLARRRRHLEPHAER